MTRIISLTGLQNEYEQEINKLLETEANLTADSIMELSERLYADIKAKDISLEDDKENDMLLFQYGTYNWGDEVGEHFSFDITRQFITRSEDMYQLSLTLVLDPTDFLELESYNSWSSDFLSIDEWMQNLKKTDGYEMTKEHPIKSHKLTFDKV